jgi:hypothetical protein
MIASTEESSGYTDVLPHMHHHLHICSSKNIRKLSWNYGFVLHVKILMYGVPHIENFVRLPSPNDTLPYQHSNSRRPSSMIEPSSGGSATNPRVLLPRTYQSLHHTAHLYELNSNFRPRQHRYLSSISSARNSQTLLPDHDLQLRATSENSMDQPSKQAENSSPKLPRPIGLSSSTTDASEQDLSDPSPVGRKASHPFFT